MRKLIAEVQWWLACQTGDQQKMRKAARRLQKVIERPTARKYE